MPKLIHVKGSRVSFTSTEVVTESRLALLIARQANKSGDEVLRQEIRLYSESRQTEEMAD